MAIVMRETGVSECYYTSHTNKCVDLKDKVRSTLLYFSD